MPTAQRILGPDRRGFAGRFDHVPALHTIVASVLEGRCGELLAGSDGPTDAAWILVPPFWFPVGSTHGDAADQISSAVEMFGGVVVAAEDWLEHIEKRCPGRSRRDARTPFSACALSLDTLRVLARLEAADLEVLRMDATLIGEAATKIDGDLLQSGSFADPEAFERDGIGFCVLASGEPVAAATSAFVSADAIEVQVNTHPQHRGRGLATLASAALLAWCMEHGVEPNWDTGNPVSARLALRLGYEQLPGYEWLAVRPPQK
jgi:GNAT superfamily N-acetyltransferase